MPDKIKPLKIENSATGGTQVDPFPTETNPAQDYLAAKGIAFENSDTRLIDLSAGGALQFTDVNETVPITVRQVRTATNNIFNPATIPWGETNVQAALANVRSKIITTPTSTATTLNGTLTLTVSSTTLQIITGTQTGYSIVLPNATTLYLGQRYDITNNSTQTITVKTNGGAVLFLLNTNSVASLTLETNPTNVGAWTQNIFSSQASGIKSYTLSSSTSFSTTSSSLVLVTDFSITPDSGTYLVLANMDCSQSTNNSVAQYSFFKAGVNQTQSVRSTDAAGGWWSGLSSINSVLQFNGAEACDVRVNISSGTLTIVNRTLVLIRLGA